MSAEMKPASPAAAAGVSRVLTYAGLRRAVEIYKGIETEGYYASPNGDHVRVEYVPDPFEDDPAICEAAVQRGIAKCKKALAGKYEVREAVAMLAHPGERRAAPVLEVRSKHWGR